MKKLLYFFLVLGLFACSSDSADEDSDNSNPPDDNSSVNLLVSSMAVTLTETNSGQDGITFLWEYTYQGNKLEEIIETRYSTPDLTGVAHELFLTIKQFSYTGNLITETYREQTGVDGSFSTSTHTFEYDSSDRLINFTTQNNTTGNLEEYNYTHNSDGSITLNTFTENSVNGVLTNCYTLEFLNNNNTSKIPCSNDNWDTLTQRTATYDTYNSPFKNIEGHSSLISKYDSPFGFYLSSNNPLHTINYYPNGNTIRNYTYDYNESGYPVSCYDGGNWLYSFEYIENN